VSEDWKGNTPQSLVARGLNLLKQFIYSAFQSIVRRKAPYLTLASRKQPLSSVANCPSASISVQDDIAAGVAFECTLVTSTPEVLRGSTSQEVLQLALDVFFVDLRCRRSGNIRNAGNSIASMLDLHGMAHLHEFSELYAKNNDVFLGQLTSQCHQMVSPGAILGMCTRQSLILR